MAMLACCTAGLMVPNLSPYEGAIAATTTSSFDRLGKLLPLRKLGSAGPAVTNLGVGGAHVGSVSEKDAQAIIEKALEEGVRFFQRIENAAQENFDIVTTKYSD